MSFLNCPRGMLLSDYREFKKYIQPYYKEVILFRWSGGILRFRDLETSARKLRKLLYSKRSEKIDIVAFSLGGFVLERALESIQDVKAQKIVFVGAVHRPSLKFDVVEIMENVYSDIDRLALLANNLYNFAIGKEARIKHKKVRNIQLKNLNHDDLSKNILLDSSGTRLYDLYRKLLLS